MYDTPFEFVIDTNSYSGNFERELCAYVTGYWDNETHGEEQAEAFYEEMGVTDENNPFEEYIRYTPTCDDDCPVLAPECLEITPAEYGVKSPYSSVGIFFEKELPSELIQLLKDRSYKFAREGKIFGDPVKDLEILGFRMFKQTVTIEELNI